jgi:hypothetical protein
MSVIFNLHLLTLSSTIFPTCHLPRPADLRRPHPFPLLMRCKLPTADDPGCCGRALSAGGELGDQRATAALARDGEAGHPRPAATPPAEVS